MPLLSLQLRAHHFNHGRQHGYHDYREQQQLEILLDERQISEEISCETEYAYPKGRARNVVYHEIIIVHLAHAGHERGERAHDGNKAGKDYRLAAVLAEIFVRFVERTLLEYPRVRIAEQFLAEEVAYHVVARIAEHRRREHYQHQVTYLERHVGLRRYGAGHEQERISGQERGDHKSCLAENYQEKNSVSPQMVVLHKLDHVLVDVQNEINDKLNIFHKY